MKVIKSSSPQNIIVTFDHFIKKLHAGLRFRQNGKSCTLSVSTVHKHIENVFGDFHEFSEELLS